MKKMDFTNTNDEEVKIKTNIKNIWVSWLNKSWTKQ